MKLRLKNIKQDFKLTTGEKRMNVDKRVIDSYIIRLAFKRIRVTHIAEGIENVRMDRN